MRVEMQQLETLQHFTFLQDYQDWLLTTWESVDKIPMEKILKSKLNGLRFPPLSHVKERVDRDQTNKFLAKTLSKKSASHVNEILDRSALIEIWREDNFYSVALDVNEIEQAW